MYDKIEISFLKFIKKETHGLIGLILKLGLKWLSHIYGIFIFIRNKAYDYQFIKSHKVNAPAIISVGNLVIGGTGKTPVTLMLSRELLTIAPLAILSRGFRSPAEHMSKPLILNRGNGPEYPAHLCGDEPFLLAENLNKAFIFVGKNRCHSADLAVSFGAKLIILDDGMQHRKLDRTFDIVVMDASDPFGRNCLVPRGLLREHKSSLKRAHLIIINHIKSKTQYQAVANEIAKFTTSPIIGTEVQVKFVEDLHQHQKIDVKGKNIGFFCALGNPSHFEETLKSLDVNIVDSLIFKDHAKFDEIDLVNFAKKCKEKKVEYLLCSEKDKVKINLSFPIELPIAWVKIELNIIEGLCHWKNFIDSTKKLVEIHTKGMK